MMTRTRLMIVGLVAVWAMSLNEVPVAATSSHVCSEVCAAASCDQECWLTQFEFDNDYPSTTCGGESYACCGDGVCDSVNEYCFSCSEDCNETSGSQCDSECSSSSQCASGEVCNAMHQCVVPAPNNAGTGTSCSNKGNCYGPDACMSSGQCAVPSRDECSGHFVCYNTPMCQAQFPAIADHVYCNPGNDRCMMKVGPGCAADY